MKETIVQKEQESGCGCPHNCYSQFPEDEMHSIQSQMAELEKPECECTHARIQNQIFGRFKL